MKKIIDSVPNLSELRMLALTGLVMIPVLIMVCIIPVTIMATDLKLNFWAVLGGGVIALEILILVFGFIYLWIINIFVK